MQLIRKIVRKILSITALPLLRIYLSSPVKYKQGDLVLLIPPGVFHPGFFFSTNYLGKTMRQMDLKGKTLLDLGTGSGMLAFIADNAGAKVTASDISLTAITNLRHNLKLNGREFKTIHSDLFDDFPNEKFDWVVINPPYYKRSPKTEAEYAWYCGEDAEYFKKLFNQLPHFLQPNARVFMVLSEDCALEEIEQLAVSKGFRQQLVSSKRICLERNYIFEFSIAE